MLIPKNMRFHRVRQPGIKWHATIVQSQENLTLHCTNKMCGTKNYSHTVPPPWKGFSLPPLPTKLNTFNLIFRPLRDPPPPPTPRNFQSLLRGEYGYFLELHNMMIG